MAVPGGGKPEPGAVIAQSQTRAPPTGGYPPLVPFPFVAHWDLSWPRFCLRPTAAEHATSPSRARRWEVLFIDSFN